MVWFTTVLSLVSYAGLMWSRPEERASEPGHYPLLFAAVLTVLGFIVAYQIHRVASAEPLFRAAADALAPMNNVAK